MKFRIYADTSVVGGCEDEEFAEHSIRLMESFVRGERVLVLSSLTIQELALAPVDVRKRLASVRRPTSRRCSSMPRRGSSRRTSPQAYSGPRCGQTRSTSLLQP